MHHFGGNYQVRDRARSRIFVLSAAASIVFLGLFALVLISQGNAEDPQPSIVIQREQPTLEMAGVLVPLQDIAPGQPLNPALFRLEQRPRIALSSRSIHDSEELSDSFARSLIVAGQPLSRDYVTKTRPTNQLTASIPEGFRAVTISVDARSSVEGWARPGARVDVMWISKIRSQQGLVPLVYNAKVLSAERQLEVSPQSGIPVPSTATLLVSTSDANKIQLAATSGSLSLSLRGDADSGKPSAVSAITVDDLLGNRPVVDRRPSFEGSLRARRADGTLQELIIRDGRIVMFE